MSVQATSALPPLVTVIIATYNRSKLVADAVESVQAQTYPNVEIIVVDDGSKDDTLAVLSRFGSRIRVLSQPNGGPGAARNNGIRHASGDLVAFLDDDDTWRPNKLSVQVRLFEDPDVHLVHAGIMFRYEDSARDCTLMRGAHVDLHDMLRGIILSLNTVVVRRSVFDELGVFDESFRVAEDYEFFMRVAAKYPSHGVDEIVADVKITPNSAGRQYGASLKQAQRVLAKHSRHHGDCAVCREAVRRSRVGFRAATYGEFKEMAMAAWRRGDYLGAMSLRFKCFYFHPGALLTLPYHGARKMLSRGR